MQMLFLSSSEHERGSLRRHLHTSPHPDLAPAGIPGCTLSQARQAAQDCEVVEMTPNLTQPGISRPFAPVYSSDLTRTIGVLQELQRLVVAPGTASLADVIQIVRDMQHQYGEDSRLEHVIQILVGRHLGQQIAARRQHHIEVVEVLS